MSTQIKLTTNYDSHIKRFLRAILATFFGKWFIKCWVLSQADHAKQFKEHVYVFFCQMPYTFTVMGRFKMVPFDKLMVLSKVEGHMYGAIPISSGLWMYRALQKKTYTCSFLWPQAEFLAIVEAFHESQNGHHERVKGFFKRTSIMLFYMGVSALVTDFFSLVSGLSLIPKLCSHIRLFSL